MIVGVRKQVMDFKAQFGEPVEVRGKKNGDIDVCFASGVTATLGSGYKYGYQGTGPLLFWHFLDAAGFKVSWRRVEQLKAPFSLMRKKKREDTKERKSGSIKVEALDEAEARISALRRIPEKVSITGIKTIQKGTNGFLGIGRKPHIFQIKYKLPVKTVEVKTKPPITLKRENPRSAKNKEEFR